MEKFSIKKKIEQETEKEKKERVRKMFVENMLKRANSGNQKYI